ncbi:MAG: helix-turn-helix transcriptional regulator [Fuscovulum sp.]|nr:MAG: helix-turn-helix transcriptional regulator [Fuscovulum sp.]
MALILRQLRKDRKWTLDDLAERSGVSKPFLSQIETGARSYTAKTIRQIADAFGLGVADLFDDATEKRSAVMGQLDEAVEQLDEAHQRQVVEYALFLVKQSQGETQS